MAWLKLIRRRKVKPRRPRYEWLRGEGYNGGTKKVSELRPPLEWMEK